MNNDTEIKETEAPEVDSGQFAIDKVNKRIKAAEGVLRELGFHPTGSDEGLRAVLHVADMYDREQSGGSRFL